MSMSKPVFVFVFSDCIGGVASFNRNLINHTSLGDQCRIKVILLKSEEDKRSPFTDEMRAEQVIRFSYSTMENQFHVLRRLNKNLGDEPGCIITDNAIVLNAVQLSGKKKHIVYLVHDYFYINWALQYSNIIDAAIAHAAFFRDILLAAAVKDYQHKAFYIPYGVDLPDSNWVKPTAGEKLKLIFLGRLVEEKGVLLLKKIHELIQAEGVKVEWTIMGMGPLQEALKQQWRDSHAVCFVQARDGNEVYRKLEEHDVLVFPSEFEGTPVSIMEALSRGVVPVVSDLPGGTRDMVTHEVGYRCTTTDPAGYAKAVISLSNSRQHLRNLQEQCLFSARQKYNINQAADAYFNFLLQQAKQPLTQKNGTRVHLSRLDSPLLPNSFVRALRKTRQKIGW